MNFPIKPPHLFTNIIDHVATGALVRKARAGKRISLRDMAIALNVSAPYLSDLERGRRNWTVERYAQAVKLIKRL
jgi:transcriptional regulator with XRE-family HTH domain